MFTLLNKSYQLADVVGLPQTCGKDRHADQGTGNATQGHAMTESAQRP